MIVNIDFKTQIHCDNCGNPLLPAQECVHMNNKFNNEDYLFCDDKCKQKFIEDNFVTDKVSVSTIMKKTEDKLNNLIEYDDEIKNTLEEEAQSALLNIGTLEDNK